ncbi:MAG: hypothetical protein U1E73_14830 [Planctomycetota bacterium]
MFPPNYVSVAEGPSFSANLPFSSGTSRVLMVYDQWDMQVPVGATITRIAFRQDAATTAMDAGRMLQLEIRMGYTTRSSANLDYNFAANISSPLVTVFGPALLQLPNLRDPAAPLPNGLVPINLTTPFHYQPGADNLLVEFRISGNSAGGAAFNYRLDRAEYYSPVVNGQAGCQHSGSQVPALALSPVRCGAPLYVNLTQGPANSFAAVLVAVGSRLVPPFALDGFVPGIASQCQGQILLPGAGVLTALTAYNGTANLSLSIPNARIPYNDMFLAMQAAFFDPFSPGGVVVSNGAQVQVGIQPPCSVLYASGPPTAVTSGSLSTYFCPVTFFDYQ